MFADHSLGRRFGMLRLCLLFLVGLSFTAIAQDLTRLSYDDRTSLEAVCSTAKYTEGPAAYHLCLNRQLARIEHSNEPDLSRLAYDDRTSLEAVCSTAKYTEGPADYHRCLNRQLAALGNDKEPVLTGLSYDDRTSIEAVCSTAKYTQGASEYHSCLSHQIAQLGASKEPSLTALAYNDRTSIEAECSTAKYTEGPAAYHSCLNRQLAQLGKQPTDHPSSSKAIAVVPAASVIAPPTSSLITPAPIGPCAEGGSCYGDISVATGKPKTVAVHGYYRSDGTYVRGYYRSK